MEFVFGYGSIAAAAASGARVVMLDGHRRRWGVAMDNRALVPGYKCFLAADGSRPPLHVAFLDIVPAADGHAVNGVCHPVTAEQLAALDRRERNYERHDVTERIEDPPGRVWAYVGSPAGRARLAAGLRAGTAVVSRAYRDTVLGAFARLGHHELAHFHASSDLDGLPVRELGRVDLTGGAVPS